MVWIFLRVDTNYGYENFGNIYNKYYTFDENLDVDDEENKKFYARLIIGDILIIRGALVVKLSSKKANLLQNLIRRPLGRKIILKNRRLYLW